MISELRSLGDEIAFLWNLGFISVLKIIKYFTNNSQQLNINLLFECIMLFNFFV